MPTTSPLARPPAHGPGLLRYIATVLREGDPRPTLLGLALVALVRGVWFLLFPDPENTLPAYRLINMWPAGIWGGVLIAAGLATFLAFAMEARAVGDQAAGLHATVRDNVPGAARSYHRARVHCRLARRLHLWSALFHAFWWMLLGGALAAGDYQVAAGAVYLVLALHAAWAFARVQSGTGRECKT